MSALTPSQYLELRLTLEKLKSELEALISVAEAGTRPVDLEEPIGRLSRMDAMQNQQMARSNHAAHEVRLDRVRESIRLMDSGGYGLCEQCRGVIPFPRLQAMPECAVCLDCQESLE